MSVWSIGNGVGRTNEVILRRARLVLRWVTVRGYTALVYNQPLRQTQPPALSGTGKLCGRECNRRSGVALSMRHRVCGTISTYGLNVLMKLKVKRDELAAYTPCKTYGSLYLLSLVAAKHHAIAYTLDVLRPRWLAQQLVETEI